jgi:hypothetical protein
MTTVVRSPSSAAGAVFSTCGRYRYLLWRQWQEIGAQDGTVLGCGLNPSTADHLILDPTMTRFIGFTRRLRYARFEMVNMYGFRSTDPRGMLAESDPVGPDNDRIIAERMAEASIVIVGWGAFPMAAARARQVAELAGGKPLYCLGITKDGWPRHPLYLRANAELRPWSMPGGSK